MNSRIQKILSEEWGLQCNFVFWLCYTGYVLWCEQTVRLVYRPACVSEQAPRALHCGQTNPIRQHLIARIIPVCINIFQRHTWNSWLYYKERRNSLSEPQNFTKFQSITYHMVRHSAFMNFRQQYREDRCSSEVPEVNKGVWQFLALLGQYQLCRRHLVIGADFQRSRLQCLGNLIQDIFYWWNMVYAL